jgi:hypothetical protein
MVDAIVDLFTSLKTTRPAKFIHLVHVQEVPLSQ